MLEVIDALIQYLDTSALELVYSDTGASMNIYIQLYPEKIMSDIKF